MDCFYKMGELVLWDIVVWVIDYEMKWLGVDCLYLDIIYKLEVFICSYFFIVFDCCKSLGINIV